jgi:hypothetical protein
MGLRLRSVEGKMEETPGDLLHKIIIVVDSLVNAVVGVVMEDVVQQMVVHVILAKI